MFLGEYEHTIDQKGRLAIPARFRSRFADGLVITRGLDGCLFVFPMPEWQEFAEKLRQLPITQSDARTFVRLMFSGAADCEMDRQGRIVIPAYLRSYARIEEDVVVAGVNTRVEVWSKASWEQVKSQLEEQGSAIAEQLARLGI